MADPGYANLTGEILRLLGGNFTFKGRNVRLLPNQNLVLALVILTGNQMQTLL
jgi:hypothetical protein